MTDQFRTVAVIGAGTIGLSWTALFAAHGLTVTAEAVQCAVAF
ncbi:3-hydroxyacyl-CoA dehydrogenase NAD-binding domain-containing protein [Streptomyces sp. NPDC059629]